jgi:transposase
MDVALDSFPDDVETLQAVLLVERAKQVELAVQIEENKTLEAERIRLEAEVDRLTAQNERYEHVIAQLRRLQFGKRSEQVDKDQLQLALEDLPQGLAEIEEKRKRPIRS